MGALHWVREKRGAVQKVYTTDGKLMGYLRLQKNHPLGPTFDVTHNDRGTLKHIGSCGGGELADAEKRARAFLEDRIGFAGGNG
jgi:hypothetical protein